MLSRGSAPECEGLLHSGLLCHSAPSERSSWAEFKIAPNRFKPRCTAIARWGLQHCKQPCMGRPQLSCTLREESRLWSLRWGSQGRLRPQPGLPATGSSQRAVQRVPQAPFENTHFSPKFLLQSPPSLLSLDPLVSYCSFGQRAPITHTSTESSVVA